MDNAAALAVVNGRLKKGEGWIGYRYSKNAHGERVQSKSLYFSFYQNGKQKFILTKTNDPEQAYRDLLEARGRVRDGFVCYHRKSRSSVTKTSVKSW
jgi:hypothetical protein